MTKIPAASVLITDDHDRLLLAQRGHDPQKGFWSLPGGTGEVGETPEETAIREAKEETNLDVELMGLAVTARMPGSGGSTYDIRSYFARVIGGQMRAGDDASQLRWVAREELVDYPLTTGLELSLRRAGYLEGPDPDGLARVRASVENYDIPYLLEDFGESSSLEEAASKREVPANHLMKTLVVRVSAGEYALVLVPGGRKLDWKALRSLLGKNRLALPDAEEAFSATGFSRGTITPFGAAVPLPLIIDETVPSGRIFLGAGAPGWGLSVDRSDLVSVLAPTVALVTIPE